MILYPSGNQASCGHCSFHNRIDLPLKVGPTSRVRERRVIADTRSSTDVEVLKSTVGIPSERTNKYSGLAELETGDRIE